MRDLGDENLLLLVNRLNLRHDPAPNVPLLGNTPVDYDSVSSDLVQGIEEAIDSHKSKDLMSIWGDGDYCWEMLFAA